MSLSKVLFPILIFSAYIPAAILTNFSVGFAYLNFRKSSLIIILLIMLWSCIYRGLKRKQAALFFSTVSLFFLYTLISILILNRGFSVVLRQTEYYLPFIISVFLMASNIKFDKINFEKYIYYTIALSALTALILYFFAADFLQTQITKYNEEAGDIFGAGRMYWDSSALGLIALFLYFANPHIKNTRVSTYAAAIIIAAMLATQNRTLILSLILIVIYFSLTNLKNVLYACLFLLAIYILYAYLPESAKNLLQTRFFFGDAGSELERAYELGRVPLYAEYWSLFQSNPIFGNGLGIAFSQNYLNNGKIYTSDISIVSFAVPFGLLGILIIFMYWWKILHCIKKKDHATPKKYKQHLLFLLLLSLGISLNFDIFSRNLFVVILTIIVFNTKVAPQYTNKFSE